MRNKIILFCFIFTLISFNKVYSQRETFKDVEYNTIAEGTDSPIAELQIVCFNKYFNRFGICIGIHTVPEVRNMSI